MGENAGNALKLFEEHHWTLGNLDYANTWSDEKRVKHFSARLVQLSAFGERFMETAVPESPGA
jgi:hypothetical protein